MSPILEHDSILAKSATVSERSSVIFFPKKVHPPFIKHPEEGMESSPVNQNQEILAFSKLNTDLNTKNKKSDAIYIRELREISLMKPLVPQP